MEVYPNARNVYTIKEYTGEIGDVVRSYGGSLVEYEDSYIELARLAEKNSIQIK